MKQAIEAAGNKTEERLNSSISNYRNIPYGTEMTFRTIPKWANS